MSEAIEKRLPLDITTDWLDRVTGRRVARVAPLIQEGVKDVEAKLARHRGSAGTGAKGSGCLLPTALVAVLLLIASAR